MAIDQVELLTHEKSHIPETHATNDVEQVIESLPVADPHRTHEKRSMESMLDFVVKEADANSPSEEAPFIRAFLTGLNWTTTVLAIGAVLFLTWAASVSILKYLAHQ
jgi:hypothetical protein